MGRRALSIASSVAEASAAKAQLAVQVAPLLPSPIVTAAAAGATMAGGGDRQVRRHGRGAAADPLAAGADQLNQAPCLWSSRAVLSPSANSPVTFDAGVNSPILTNQSGGSSTTTTLPPIAAAAARQQPAASAPGAHHNRVYKAGGPSTFFTMDLVVPDPLVLLPASAGAAGSGVLLCAGGGSGGIGLGGVIRIGRGGVAPTAIAGAGLALSSQAAAAAVAAGARSSSLASQAGYLLSAVVGKSRAAMGLLAAEAAAAAISGGSGLGRSTADDGRGACGGALRACRTISSNNANGTSSDAAAEKQQWRLLAGVGVDVIERAFGDAAARVSAAEGVLQQYWELEVRGGGASDGGVCWVTASTGTLAAT
ncbi:hypothetical protein DFJ73DRAFT_800033 [Zopfochytrium polystomum]|nr:hypothetical protein DFJ73DRAFT_803551 [Zopfochytrium polystomum]KAI9322934.1 hypothetical protein DFJ73DRAFT_802975 [Zopfochytrium polystomum]KAI9330597.1 hypothetical protein DFJ73DRAFT_800033 [Zopfochytrium polystomum]